LNLFCFWKEHISKQDNNSEVKMNRSQLPDALNFKEAELGIIISV